MEPLLDMAGNWAPYLALDVDEAESAAFRCHVAGLSEKSQRAFPSTPARVARSGNGLGNGFSGVRVKFLENAAMRSSPHGWQTV